MTPTELNDWDHLEVLLTRLVRYLSLPRVR
jgi:hypothetical protein